MSILNLKENVFQLPSQGEPYRETQYADGKMQFINGDSVKLRPMTVGDQRYLAGVGGDAYQTYYGMIDRLVVEPKLEVDDLLMDDVNALLFTIRILSFGADYELAFDCHTCNHPNKHSLKLTDLEIINADEREDFDGNFQEIKVGKHTLMMHSLRMSDEKAVSRQMKNLSKTNLIQNEFVDRLYVRYAQLIDKINGETPKFFKDKMTFIDNLAISDLDELANQINSRAIGVIPQTVVECQNGQCGIENTVRVGISAAFFRPNPKH